VQGGQLGGDAMAWPEGYADPSHERHEEIAEWWGADPRDLDTIDIPAIEAEIAKLARRWSRKPRTKK
jgi:hypothetical protein